jgi:transcriptional regulator with XRE-family HTH domain
MTTAERIQALRIESGSTAQNLATALGMTVAGYDLLEHNEDELDSAVSIAQALQLAKLLHTDVLQLLGESEKPIQIPIARIRSALNAHLGSSAEAREGMEDVLDWDLGPFLEGSNQWTTVYTIEFVRKLATAIEVDWQVLLAAIELE